jgi:hypothetical protein
VDTSEASLAVPSPTALMVIPPSDPPAPEPSGEMIAGYRIHPFASRFPLLQGQAFEELVESIAELGLDVPIELKDSLVIDGRNRLRAIAVLRDRGTDVAVRTVEWQPRNGESVEEHVYAVNVARRHLTDDQRAMLATELLPVVRRESATRQAATRFGTVTAISESPEITGESPHPHPERGASTTLGRLAGVANVTPHRMRRAVELRDDISAGLVPQEEADAVIRGDKPLRKAGLKKPRRTAAKKKPAAAAPLEHLSDATDDDEADGVTLEDFVTRWERLKNAYAVTEHRRLREIALKHITDEQQKFDRT